MATGTVCVVKEFFNADINRIYVCGNPTITEDKIQNLINKAKTYYKDSVGFDYSEAERSFYMTAYSNKTKKPIDYWSWFMEDHEIIES